MATTNLTDTQRAILTAACKRKDRRVFPIAVPGLKGGAVTAVLKSLLKNGFVEETPALGDDHVWRKGDGDVPLTLKATAAAFRAMGVGQKARRTRKPTAADVPRQRADTKQAKVIAMLNRRAGATVEQIIKVTDWQPHTVRGFLAGCLKKRLGLKVTSERAEGGERVYRVSS